MIRIFPIEGFVVRHPDSFRVVSEAGEVVTKSMYWLRREAEGAIRIEAIVENKKQDIKEPEKTNNKNNEGNS